MKKNIIKNLVIVCCIFVFGISSAFALKNISDTYAVSYDYVARFYSNGGTWVSGNASDKWRDITYSGKYYLNNSNISVKRDGCTFGGWKVESTGKVLHEYIDSEENTEKLYAVWNNCSFSETTSYKVSFNTNGGSTNPTTQTIKSGGTVSKPSNPTKTGHTFQHWSTSSSGSAYNFSTKVTKDFTLYAVWSVNKYTVKFNSNGGSSVSEQIISYGNTVNKPSNPTRSGYTFQYWSTSSSGSSYNFGTAVTSNFTLYAIWKKNETSTTPTPEPTPTPDPTPTPAPSPTPTPSPTYYTINFDLNGGKGSIQSQSVAEGNKVIKPTNPTKENATFKGWSTNKKCSDSYDFEKKVTKNFTLYACFTSSYSVTFNMQGLPYIESYKKEFSEKSNLNEYKKEYSLTIFDTSTYSMLDIDNCPEYLEDLSSNLNSEKLQKECNNISNILNCQNNTKCYGEKYLVLDDSESESILYLEDNNIIKIEYEIYNYIGLYRDRECKNEYKYSSSISKDLNLYECYKLLSNEDNENDSNDTKKKKKSGVSVTVTLIIIALLIFVFFILYLIRKGKIANRVD